MIAKFMCLGGMAASWVAKGIEDCLELIRHEGFFRELRMGSRVFIIQHHANTRGSFLQLSKLWNGRRKILLVILEGANGIGWKGFLQSIRSVIGEFGKTVGRPSSVKGASYAAVLRSLAGSPIENNSAAEGKSKALVTDKGRQVTLGEVEGVLWDVKAQLKGVIEYVRDLMIKVDKRLDLVMGFGSGPSMDEGGRRVDPSSLKATSVQAKDVSTPSQIGSLDASIFVHASVTMPLEGAVGPQSPYADEIGTSVQGSSLVEDGGPSKILNILEETVKPLLEDANGVTEAKRIK
ncbi:uncharacterized protein LOC118344845 [Juglans regia]|uniref:Uncharacterized protein LOC118344845 n=1 Tax=Juglans regia TaxID=51240 RepID=A0A6P9E4B5_JUGRE|nr:uncharacterized protein LOC118344845 [Juglans regia]